MADTVLGDSVQPLQLWKTLHSHNIHAALFESCEGGERWGRYTLIAAQPLCRIMGGNGSWLVAEDGQSTILEADTDPLDWLQKQLQATDVESLHELDIPSGGFYGVLGYEVMQYIEPRVKIRRDPERKSANVDMFEPSILYVFDNVRKLLHIVDILDGSKTTDVGQATSERHTQHNQWLREASTCVLPLIDPDSETPIAVESNPGRPEYEASVAKGIEAIRAGEAVQIVLAQQFDAMVDVDPLDLYRVLRVVNPSPYMFLLPIKQATLIGSSPEVMVRLQQGKIELRPIAGTRPRGKDEDEDRRLEDELMHDPKELAEHIMLIDLGRNDVGRVAKFGSVEVPEKFVVERYSHVMHIVSQVEGQLQEGKDAIDLFRATFPAGTLSGAPKVRACELIHDLESIGRGCYSGTVGYFDYRGNMDTCIVIRTFEHQRGRVRATAGAGIVFDSIPARENDECHNKARGLMRALSIVVGNQNSQGTV